MYCADLNEDIRLYYKAHNNEPNRTDCIIDIYKDDGDHILDEYPAVELGDGIYYVDIVGINDFCYLLVRGWVQERPNSITYDIVKVGHSEFDKIFYKSTNYQTGLDIPYSIYDLDYNLYDSGLLTEFGYGFYFLEIHDQGKFFVKILHHQKLVDIPLCKATTSMVTGGGGVIKEVEEIDKCKKYNIKVIGLSTEQKQLNEVSIKILNLHLDRS